MKTNLLFYMLIILVIVVLIIVMVVDETPVEEVSTKQSASTAYSYGDRDNPSEEVKAVGSQINQIREQQDIYKMEINQKITEIYNELQSLHQKIQSLTTPSLRANQRVVPESRATGLSLGQEPVAPHGNSNENEESVVQSPWVWIEDSSRVVGSEDISQSTVGLSEPLPTPLEALASNESSAVNQRQIIPPATIIEGITLTAVIGRLPIRGKVNEPWPVKIISTAKGYAPNGYALNTAQMIWEGQAFGDASFECARIVLTRVTSVLADDVISYIEAKNKDQGLAYVTDSRGNPCLAGKLISNVAKHLSTEAIFGIAQGASEAYADNEQTRSVSSEGNVVESVTGNRVRVLVGQALAKSASNVKNYLASRYDVWDAIYVAPNKKVVINVDQPLNFTYDKNEKLFDASRFTFDIDSSVSHRLD